MIGSVYNRLTESTIKSKEDSFRIYKIDLASNSKVIFYEINKSTIDSLILSQDNKYIAVTRGEKYPKTEIVIIDKKQRTIKYSINVPEGIIAYAWSPDSKRIAYVTGQPDPAEMRGLISNGVWVYDLEKKEKKKIGQSALAIEYLPSGDLCLSMDRDKMHAYKSICYRDINGEIRKIEKKGINISLDGRYSIDPQYIDYMPMTKEDEESTHLAYYDLKTGKKIKSSSLDKIYTEMPRIMWGPVLWLKGNRIVVQKIMHIDPKNLGSGVASNVRDILICEIENNKVLKELKGNVVGVNSDRSKFVVYLNGKFLAVDVP
jgi:dipeptidyl aminopeptidase/acylaminoacyl peptidase